MRQRPIGQLVEMLRNLGARIEYIDATGFPPLIAELGTAVSTPALTTATTIATGAA